MNQLAEKKLIDIYYADQTLISRTPCIPYGWQFQEEKVGIPTSKEGKISCFGMISPNNNFVWSTTPKHIDS
jgi:hypothetical protein